MIQASHIAPEELRPLRRVEYERMVAAGFFEDERLELLHGVLVTLSPQNALHAEAVTRLARWLMSALLGRATVRVQCPLALTDESEPEPDVAVVPEGDYSREHPATAWLVIEVSDASLAKDRNVKASLYAAAGVPEYWLVNLQDRVVEVRSEPAGDAYGRVEVRGPGDALSPSRFPEIVVDVAEIVPRSGP